MTLIDTNVLLDILTNDPVWTRWSLQQIDRAAIAGPLVINDIIYAELAVGFPTIEALNAAVEAIGLRPSPMPQEALFLAAKVFKRYRARGGTRTGILPDFFIRAHAAVIGAVLLTRDVRRIRGYFPSVSIVCPEDRI